MDHKKSEILLETGTNEIEIMQFTINDILYGINVAKVREIMMPFGRQAGGPPGVSRRRVERA